MLTEYPANEIKMIFRRLAQEAPAVMENQPEDWPQSGKIEFKNYSVRYRPDTEIVLRDLSFSVKDHEKVRLGPT